ncbi:MAG: 3-hydroxyacyl-CoA dehydrogenase family protein, partial [Pseudomonadota bacterium]|nr:3-hydroxyacyl-CoA dehydrogenase family protein [Pseudomonadota bacterium]
ALLLLDEGMPAPAVDRVATDFGMPVGPVELADNVGLDVALAVAEVLAQPLDLEIPQLLRDRVAAGRLGRKSGGGFYSHANGRVFKAQVAKRYVAPLDVQDRLILRLLNEAVRCLRLGVVADADQLDVGLIFGAGFAPFRGGPLYYARQRGFGEIVSVLERLAQRHGTRFNPDPGWADLAAD